MKSILVIPGHNVGRTVGELVTLARKYVSEVLVVDDNSVDKTDEISSACGALTIKLQGPGGEGRGKGLALRTGFTLALRRRAELVITIDGDGENDPTDIPVLLRSLVGESVDAVLGARVETHSSLILGFKPTKIFLKEHFGILVDDPMSGIRAYRSSVIETILPKLRSAGFGIDLEILLQMLLHGFSFTEVSVSARDLVPRDGFKVQQLEASCENLSTYRGSFQQARLDVFDPQAFMKAVSCREPIRITLNNKPMALHFNPNSQLYEP